MIHPSDPGQGRRISVRDGQLAPVTCSACGCRLEDGGDGQWLHFGRLGGRDARGCRVDCVEVAHNASGEPAVALLV
jgi:hypothetical protein